MGTIALTHTQAHNSSFTNSQTPTHSQWLFSLCPLWRSAHPSRLHAQPARPAAWSPVLQRSHQRRPQRPRPHHHRQRRTSSRTCSTSAATALSSSTAALPCSALLPASALRSPPVNPPSPSSATTLALSCSPRRSSLLLPSCHASRAATLPSQMLPRAPSPHRLRCSTAALR